MKNKFIINPVSLFIANFMLAGIGIFSSIANASEAELSGSLTAEGRYFFHEATLAGQGNGRGVSLVVAPELYKRSDNGKDSFLFAPFARLDEQDSERQHWDIREAYWLRAVNDWEVKLGLGKVFWGVTESNHLVDIINQTDAVEASDAEDKLGQPMLQISALKEYGTFRAFIMPYFRERNFIGKEGRLRGGKYVDDSLTSYDSGHEERHLDVAFRYEHVLGDWDIGLSHFSGTSREALLLEKTNASGEAVLAPHYDLINQESLDLQYTGESWLWKMEAITRSGHGERFSAFSGGFEYSFYGILETPKDLGLLMEYHHDDRGEDAPATGLNDDIFIGARLAWNDIQDMQLLAGMMIDRETKNRSYSVEASRRVGENFKLEIEGTIFSGQSTPSVSQFNNEDFVQVSLGWYF